MTSLRSDRVRVCMLAGTMVVSAVLFVIAPLFAIDEPDGARPLVEAVSAERAQFFTSAMLFALAVVTFGISGLGFMLLARRRGHVLGTIGGSLMFLGGVAFSSAFSTYGTALYVATEGRVGVDSAVRLQNAAEDTVVTGIPFLVGFFGVAIGVLLVTISLLRARTAPLWVPIVLVLGTILLFFSVSGTALDALFSLPLAVALCGGAWALLTRGIGQGAPAAESAATAALTPPGQHRRVEPVVEESEHGTSSP